MERTKDLCELVADDEQTCGADDAPVAIDRPSLDEDVTQANLKIYSDTALAGRLAHYEREALFERNHALRAEFKRETDRTRIEQNRRKLYAQAEAKRVFSL